MTDYKAKYALLVNRLLESLRSHYGERLTSVVLYGSVARGSYRKDSDIDFLVIAKDLPEGSLKRFSDYYDAVECSLQPALQEFRSEGLYPYVSPILKTPSEIQIGSLLFLDMIEDARILYDRDDFFKLYLERLDEKLKKLGAKKVLFGKGYYWDLKPDYQAGDVVQL